MRIKKTPLASAVPGSDNYYALRTVAQAPRAAIALLLTLFDTLLKIPFTLSEDSLVRIKLQWWHEEIQKTEQQHASHPLCLALYAVMDRYSLPYTALLDLINTLQTIVQQCPSTTEASLRHFYSHTYGIRERMIAQILVPHALERDEHIQTGAYCLAVIDNLRHLRQRALKSYVFFSEEEARALGVDKNQILTLTASESLTVLAQRQIEKIEAHFQRIKNTPPLYLQPLLIRVYLGLQWCYLARDEAFPLFTHHIELTPLRKWWSLRKL